MKMHKGVSIKGDELLWDLQGGLSYLHDHWDPRIMHRDVKAANILLDEEFESICWVFWFTTRIPIVTTAARGTIGHISPEYLSTESPQERLLFWGIWSLLLDRGLLILLISKTMMISGCLTG